MRLNLNCRDADIQQINPSEYRITFDLSKMIKPRLSENARMYIEHLNLPEFVDEAFGANNGEMRGYFELRCDNIDSNDFDTEFGNSGNNILYTSPLSNFKTFTNNNPMYISNFKISQNFLQNKLVMSLKVYDQFGTPYTTARTVASVVDEDSLEFKAYKTTIEALHILDVEKTRVSVLYNSYKSDLEIKKSEELLAKRECSEKMADLIKAIDYYLRSKPGSPLAVRNRIKTETLRDLVNLYDVEAYIYLFDEHLPPRYGEEPYSIYAAELKVFYKSFLILTEIQYDKKHFQAVVDNLISSKNVRLGTTAIFESSENVKPIINPTTFNYTVVDPLSLVPNKTGTVQLQYFKALSENYASIVVDDITPSDDTSANELAVNDFLIVDSGITTIIPVEYEYFFAKSSHTKPNGVDIPGIANSSRFALIVKRKNTVYTIEMKEDLQESINFVAGSTIKILGSELGGATPGNDLIIKIDSAVETPPFENYVLDPFIAVGFEDNGFMNIEIQKNNASHSYALVSSDFTNTSNFKSGDEILIPAINLGGDDNVNDAIIKVDDVFQDYKYSLNQTNIIHSIPLISINANNSTVYNSTGALKTSAIDYTILISSEDGVYTSFFDVAGNGGATGFAQDDYIIIEGGILTGVDGANDLKLIISTDGTLINKITGVVIDTVGTYTARKPLNPFGFDAIVKVNVNTYEIQNIIGGDFKANDTLAVSGVLLGGDGTNNLKINILTITPTNTIATTNVVGLPNFDNGNYGQIKTLLAVVGTAKTYIFGKILSHTIESTNLAIDTLSVAIPDIKITITQDSFEGLSSIDTAIQVKYNTITTQKKSLVNVNTTYITQLGQYQKQKMNCMNIRLVLYDEVPEYTQSSKDAIVGNTYSRLTGCQFKRI